MIHFKKLEFIIYLQAANGKSFNPLFVMLIPSVNTWNKWQILTVNLMINKSTYGTIIDQLQALVWNKLFILRKQYKLANFNNLIIMITKLISKFTINLNLLFTIWQRLAKFQLLFSLLKMILLQLLMILNGLGTRYSHKYLMAIIFILKWIILHSLLD